MALDIDERHLLRLGHGEEALETEKDFSRSVLVYDRSICTVYLFTSNAICCNDLLQHHCIITMYCVI